MVPFAHLYIRSQLQDFMHFLRRHETGGAIGAFGRVVQVPFPVWDFAVAVIAHPHEQEDQQPKYNKADPDSVQVIRKIQ